jgi:diadenosine tetraphosphate (Ap4A) HIT family hydrolase
MHCNFCDNKEVQDRAIYRDDLVWAFPTYQPVVPGHILVVPVRHLDKIDQLTDEETVAMKNLVIKMKNALKKTFDAEGFNCAWNEGEMAGQSVMHLHLHVLPRKTGDTGIYQYDPGKFLYRPSIERPHTPQEELLEIVNLIKPNLE